MAITIITPEEIAAIAPPEQLEAFALANNPKSDTERIPMEAVRKFLGTRKLNDPVKQCLAEYLIATMAEFGIYRLKVPACHDDDPEDSSALTDLIKANGYVKNPDSIMRRDLARTTPQEVDAYYARVGTFQNVGNLFGLLMEMEAPGVDIMPELTMRNELMDVYDEFLAQKKTLPGDSRIERANRISEKYHAIMYDDEDRPFIGRGPADWPAWRPFCNYSIKYAEETVHTYVMATNYDEGWVKRFIIGGVKDFLGKVANPEMFKEREHYQYKALAYGRVGLLREMGVKYLSNPPRIEPA